MKVKYNRVSTIQQSGLRFTEDKESYDIVYMDKISGSVAFKDRHEALHLVKLINKGEVTDLVVEEFSRLGRNTGDVITTLEWLESKGINVTVRNIGLQSRPGGVKNPIWKMISSVMSSLYEMELQNIKERTTVGRMVYVQNGGKLGRPTGSNESDFAFLQKNRSQQIERHLNKGFTIRETSKIVGVSAKTVMKVKTLLKQVDKRQ